mmetsp:Transcript_7543/g.15064  ORF Transcript_7543/g.15064 Transcript_7543/m.15064 type:complete len:92 (+) Transcript_7543:594-869(+)
MNVMINVGQKINMSSSLHFTLYFPQRYPSRAMNAIRLLNVIITVIASNKNAIAAIINLEYTVNMIGLVRQFDLRKVEILPSNYLGISKTTK